MVDIVANKKTFDIGRFQENEYRRVVFDVSDVVRQYPDATFVVLNKRSGDDEAYPVPPERITVEGGKLYWILSSADVSYDGYGQCAVTAYSGTVVAKSMRYNVRVDAALDGTAEPPEPWTGWVEQVHNDAERAAAAAELLEHPGAEAETIPAGSEATAAYAEGTFSFGIPAGEKGDPGEPGEDGYSPSASVAKAGNTATITITDKTGTTTASVSDGEPGEDGFSPSASVSKTGSVATISITDKNGTTTAQVSDGQDGEDGYSPSASVSKSGDTATITITDKTGTTTATVTDGQDGYTPQRGTDYWTAEDQAVIISAVEDAVEPEISEVKSAIDGKAPVISRTASGDIVSFSDGADNMPLSSCVVSIDPVQAAGTPTPEIPLPISGRTGAQIIRTGMNLLAGDMFNHSGGKTVYLGMNDSTSFPYFLKAGTYTLWIEAQNVGTTMSLYLREAEDSGNTRIDTSTSNLYATFTTEKDGYYRFWAYNSTALTSADIKRYQLALGSEITAYQPYQGQTYAVDWQTAAGTVYGGTLDTVNGVLTVTDGQIASYAGETLPGAWISDRDVYTPGGTPTTGAQVVYKLATPQTVQLSAVEIKALLGENNLWADTGAISLTYPADTQTYVDSAITAATDPDGNVVQVTGTTPSITGESGKRYVCGTVDSISITPPQTGIIDVVFTSGTTPTVLTASGVVWPGWFDPNSLSASTVYDITIKDGYGVVNTWS